MADPPAKTGTIGKQRNAEKWPRAPGFKPSWQKFKTRNPQISEAMTVFDRCKRAVPPEPLPGKMEDHKLDGPLKGFMDCHLDFDVVLIYKPLPNGAIKLLRVCDHSYLKGPKAKVLARLLRLE
jgi:addiction module RelE/StbE family toxin